jgi:hypothetical protein
VRGVRARIGRSRLDTGATRSFASLDSDVTVTGDSESFRSTFLL